MPSKINSLVAVIPEGYRPNNVIIYPCAFSNTFGYATILQNGNVFFCPFGSDDTYGGFVTDYYI